MLLTTLGLNVSYILVSEPSLFRVFSKESLLLRLNLSLLVSRISDLWISSVIDVWNEFVVLFKSIFLFLRPAGSMP